MSYSKDKKHKIESIDDDSNIHTKKDIQTSQCPKCLSIFSIGCDHKCSIGWKWCSICGLDLHKKGKEILHNGIKYVTLPYKKSFHIMDKIVCWECAFKIVKAFKEYKK